MNRIYRMLILSVALLITPSAHAQDADSARLADQLVQLQLNGNTKIKAGDTLTEMVTPLVLRENPGQEQQIAAIAEKTIKPTMTAGAENIARQNADMYVQAFSKEELQQLLDFYNSPLGQKYRRFSVENMTKMRDVAKNESADKAQDSLHQFVAGLKQAGLRVPQELEH